MTSRASLLAIVALVVASPAAAAPIYGDVTLEGGIHLWSDDVFIAWGYWTDEITDDEVLSHPFMLPVTFDAGRYRVDTAFPTSLVTCGTFQVDAWWHGGWWGELRPTSESCGGGAAFPALPPEFSPDPPIVDPRSDPDPPVPVPEPTSLLLLSSGVALCARRIATRLEDVAPISSAREGKRMGGCRRSLHTR